MDIHTLLVMGHVIGAILGAGGATVAEIQINIALKDGKVEANERALMHGNYWMIRAGLAFILVSGALLVITMYQDGTTWVLTSPKIWIKEVMTAMIILNAMALSYRKIPLWLGASISFTSWWGATLLGLSHKLPFTFWQFAIGYAVAILVVAGILHMIRKKFMLR